MKGMATAKAVYFLEEWDGRIRFACLYYNPRGKHLLTLMHEDKIYPNMSMTDLPCVTARQYGSDNELSMEDIVARVKAGQMAEKAIAIAMELLL